MKEILVTDSPVLPDASDSAGVDILVIRPHPDDESSATGSMLARYAELGVRTGVVICNGGEEGEIRDPDLDPEADRPRLGEIREREVRDACRILGVDELRLLGYRDSGMADTPANQHPEAFCQADPVEAAGRLVRIIRELRPLVMVTEPPGGAYGHPDHIKCYDVSADAFHAAGDASAYPDAGPAWSVPKLYSIAQIDDGTWETLIPELKAAGFDVGDRAERKRDSRPGPETATVALDVRAYTDSQWQALLAHRTQVPADSFWARMPTELRRRAFATAYFIRHYPPAEPGEREVDLLDGLNIRVGTAPL